MAHETEEVAPRGAWRSVVKLGMIGFLGLLLLIPVSQVLGLVRERQQREREVQAELARLWGGPQTVGALVVAAPLRSTSGPVEWIHFLPAEVSWSGALRPERRSRGIFEVTLYEARLAARGWFRRPDPTVLGVAPERVDWDRAVAVLAIDDPRGVAARPALRWQGGERAFLPGVGPLVGLFAGVQAPLGAGGFAPAPGSAERIEFAIDLVLRGSEALQVLPFGELTRVELAAPWSHPSFVGAPLPQRRRVGPSEFTASWEVPYFGRGFPQQWRSSENAPERLRHVVPLAAFGVSLARPADPYQQTERAVKYAVLFIALTFTTVFLLELLSPVRLHPVHYLLVGFALCLFYLLLLALGEHLGVVLAYTVAAGSIAGLVTLYARAVLAGWGRASVLGAALAGLYTWLYTLLRAEDYALLLGAGGLFAVLATVMFLTRRLDWGTLRFGTEAG
jgi:inner membrane protein